MPELPPRAFHDRLQQLMQARGWRDPDSGAADAILLAASSAPEHTLVDLPLAGLVPEDFYARNGIDTRAMRLALNDWMGDTTVGRAEEAFELITIDDIDSFAKVRDVTPDAVAAFSSPLRVNERVVKHCIHIALGDPYIDEDWGGERADITTDRVLLRGRRTLTAFLLKGRSVLGPLYGSELGKRGDQIVRLMEERAQLSIVQHINQIPAETVDQLRFGVASLRVGPVPGALLSAWDGVDTPRLLVAYGYLGLDGKLTDRGRAADELLKKKRKPKRPSST